MTADGIDVRTSLACTHAAGTAGDLRVGYGCGTEIRGSHVLVVTGRTPKTDTLGLDHLDLEPDAAGHLPVDHRPTGD